MNLRQLPLLAISLVLLGCSGSRSVQNEAAVRQGVIDYLSQRSDLNLPSMQVEVTSVSFRQNEADATVSFRPKGATAGMGMTMRYTLERQGNRWVVKGRGRGRSGAAPHGMGQMMPGGAGAPAAGTPAGQGGSGLPPGHPPIGGQNPPGGRPR
ncbi:MAG: hypothetical protein ABSD56_09985 [Bryobacteraceae bacterium]